MPLPFAVIRLKTIALRKRLMPVSETGVVAHEGSA
jgi:hypothetical protein